jgi:hypothetical protein
LVGARRPAPLKSLAAGPFLLQLLKGLLHQDGHLAGWPPQLLVG